LPKAKFLTYIHDASGLKVGDPVVLMGFQVGQITGIAAMPPRTAHAVRIEFEINQINQDGEPYFSYVWSEGSWAKINASDFLGKRSLEVTRGTNGFGIYNTHSLEQLPISQAENISDPENWRLAENVYDADSNLVLRAYRTLAKTNVDKIAALKHESLWAFHDNEDHREPTAVWNQTLQRYESWNEKTNSPYWLPVLESSAVTEQLQGMVSQVQAALPAVLALTNQLAAVLNNAAIATSNLDITIVGAQPMLTNFAIISGELRDPGGVVNWALGTNGATQLQTALTNANALLVSADTNITALLVNLSDITSNLNKQVQDNPSLLFGIAKTIRDSDDFVQGLKHHWLLRSAFKNENKQTEPQK
jgi:hypothetical protein